MSNRISTRIRVAAITLIALAALAASACGSEPGPTTSGVTLFPPPTATQETRGSDDQPTITADDSTLEPSPGSTATEAATDTDTDTATATRVPVSTSEPTPLNADDLDPLADDPTALMFAILENSLPDVERKMANSHNDAFIPVLMELMRFQWNREAVKTIASHLVRIRDRIPEGESAIIPHGEDNWGWWQEWLAQNPEIRGPAEYDRWKGALFSLLIDPEMGKFIYAGVPTTIRLEEVVWGGVRRDGIPDLRFPTPLAPEEATYLDPGDRVFGVSINGEHRAYPLRVLNAHEMANDILGGVQFALAY